MTPIAGGIIKLSKSASGSTSINIAHRAIINEVTVQPQQQKVETNTAIKQVKLPATVFP